MQDFIVLGLVPGTNIQISFQTWLIICGLVVLIILLVMGRYRLRATIMSLYVAHLIRRRHLA